MCWIANASQPSLLRDSRWATRRSNARPAVRTRSTGCISPSIVRIGFTRNVRPAPARPADPGARGPDPPAAAQVLERVHHDEELQVTAHRLRGLHGAREVG